jgi:hypothetical protein
MSLPYKVHLGRLDFPEARELLDSQEEQALQVLLGQLGHKGRLGLRDREVLKGPLDSKDKLVPLVHKEFKDNLELKDRLA